MLKTHFFICLASSALSSFLEAEPKKIMLLEENNNPKIHKETAKLIYLINHLNPKDRGIEEDTLEDDFKIRDEISQGALEEIMKIIQKNYDADAKDEDLKPPDLERIHVISNPEILDAYKKQMEMRRHRSTSSSSDDSSSDLYDFGRRNAAFRLLDDATAVRSNEVSKNLQSKRTIYRSDNQNNFRSEFQTDNLKPLKIDTIPKEKYDRLDKPYIKAKRFDKTAARFDIGTEKDLRSLNKDESLENDDDYVKRDRIDWGSDKDSHNDNRKKKSNNAWNEKKKNEWDLSSKDEFREDKSQPKWSMNLGGSFKRNEVKKHGEDSGRTKYVTKQNRDVSKDWKDYVSKSKKVERSGNSFGRTPIPFVGKRGIYEE